MAGEFDFMDEKSSPEQPKSNGSPFAFMDDGNKDVKTMASAVQNQNPQEAQSKITPPEKTMPLDDVEPKTKDFMLQSGDHTAAMMPNVKDFNDVEKNHQNFKSQMGVMDTLKSTWNSEYNFLPQTGHALKTVGERLARGGLSLASGFVGTESSLEKKLTGGHEMPSIYNMFGLFKGDNEQKFADKLDKWHDDIKTNFENYDYDKAIKDIKDGNYSRVAQSILGSTIEGLPQMVAMMVEPWSVIGTSSVKAGKDVEKQDIQSGAKPEDAQADGVVQGMTTGILQAVFQNEVVNGLFKNAALKVGQSSTTEAAVWYAKTLLKSMGLMGAQGAVQSGVSDVSKKKFGIDEKALRHIVPDMIWGSAQSAPLGAFGLLHAGESYKLADIERQGRNLQLENSVHDLMGKGRAQTRAEVNQENLAQAFETYEKNKANDYLKTAHLDAVTGDDEKLYTSAQNIDEYAKSQGTTGDQLARELNHLQDYENSKKNGTPFALKPSEVISKFAGTPHTDAASRMFSDTPVDPSLVDLERNEKQDAVVDKKETSDKLNVELPRTHEELEEYLKKARGEGFTEGRRNRLTGLPSEEELHNDYVPGHHQMVAVDMDGMGALNEVMTHTGADEIIKRMGGALKGLEDASGGRLKAYHLHGDEFALIAKPGEDIRPILEQFQKQMDNETHIVPVKNKEGNYDVYKVKGPRFSFGIGDKNARESKGAYHSADIDAAANKTTRTDLRESKEDVVKSGGKSKFIQRAASNVSGSVVDKIREREGSGRLAGQKPERVPSAYSPSAGSESLGGDVKGVLPEDAGGGQENHGQVVNAIEQKLKPFKPLLDKIAALGVAPEKAKRYADWVNSVYEQVKKDVAERILSAKRKSESAEFKDRVGRVKDSAEKEAATTFDKTPELVSADDARKVLQNGTYERDNTLIDIPEAYRYKDTPDLRYVAEMFNYGSVDEMLKKISTLPDREEFIKAYSDKAVDQFIDEETTEDAMSDDEMIDLAIADRLKFVARKTAEEMASDDFGKFKGMARQIVRKPRSAEETERLVAKDLRGMKYSDSNPEMFKKAAEKANRDAFEHYISGRVDEAFDAKEREEYNHEMFQQAKARSKEIGRLEKLTKSMGKKAAQERLSVPGKDHFAQAKSIISRFGLPGRSYDGTPHETMDEYIKNLKNEGKDASFGEIVKNGTVKFYKDLTNEELDDVKDAIFKINTFAQKEGKIFSTGKEIEKISAIEEMSDVIRAHNDVTPKPDDQVAPDLKKKFGSAAATLDAILRRPDMILDELAGNNKLMAPWNYLYKPGVACDLHNHRLMDEFYHSARKEIERVYGKKLSKAGNKSGQVFIPELKTDRFSGNLSHFNIVKLMLYHGTESGGERASGLTDEQMNAVGKAAWPEDIHMAKFLWNLHEKLWPIVKEHHFQQTGINKKPSGKIPFDFKTADGTNVHMEGGYAHIAFTDEAYMNMEKNMELQDMFGSGSVGVATSQSHLIGRVGTGGRPLDLSLDEWFSNMNKVLKDVSHRQFVSDFLSLTQDKQFRQLLIDAIGKKAVEALDHSIKEIAGARDESYYKWWNQKWMSTLTDKTTIMDLGYNITTGLIHAPMAFVNLPEIGAGNFAYGLKRMAPWKWSQTLAETRELSEVFKNRDDAGDINLKETLAGIKPGPVGDAIRASMMFIRGMMKLTGAVLWHAAYNKVMTEGLPKSGIEKGDARAALDYADSMLEQAQGTSEKRGLPQIQTGPALVKFFTRFMTPGVTAYGQARKALVDFSNTGNKSRLAASMALLWFLPAALKWKLKDGELDDLWKYEVEYPADWFPGVRDIAHTLLFPPKHGLAEAEFSPQLEEAKAIPQAIAALMKPFKGKQMSHADLQAIADTVSMFGPKFPTHQVLKTSEYMWDWSQGNIAPDNVFKGVYEALTTGEKAEKQ